MRTAAGGQQDGPVHTWEELVERARRLTAGGRRVLGIAGAPGSGKSTLAARLVTALAPAAVLVPMDGFHLASKELERLSRSERKGAPDTFDVAGYVALLRRVREPGLDPVYAPAFDRTLEEAVAGAIPIDPATPLVVTEGNYLLLDQGSWAAVHGLLDESWFLDVDEALRVERLVARHVQHGKARDAAELWVAGSDAANARLIHATRNSADLVVVPGWTSA